MIINKISELKNFDLEAASVRAYRRIDTSTRNVFFAGVGLNILAWFIFYVHHPLHNHILRMPWIDWNEQSYLGRWFNNVVLRIIHAADMPTLLPLLSSILAVFAALVALRIWRLDLTAIERFLIVGMISVFPFFLSFYYYTWITPLFMFSCLFAVGALAVNTRLQPTPILLGALLFMLMMASYQTAISIYATVAASAIICDLIRKDGPTLLQIAKLAAARIIAAILGGAGYLASLKLLNVGSTHATTMVELSTLPSKFIDVSKAAVRHLTLTQPEFLLPLKFLLLAIVIVGAASTLWLARRSLLRAALILPMWAGLLIATKLMFLISDDSSFYQYRYNSSMAFFYAFAAAVALHAGAFRPYRSFIFVCVVFVVLRFVEVDLIRQEVLLRGQQHDLAIANRILYRIESLPDFDPSKTYDLVRVGKYSRFRQDTLGSKGRNAETYGDGHMDHGEITDRWSDEQIMILLGSKIKFRNRGFDPNFLKKMDDFRKKYAGEKQKWPHQDSVFIEEDVIYVYME